MVSLVPAGVALTVVGVTVTLVFHRRGRVLAAGVAKGAASVGFLLVALGAGALASRYGQWILGALTASLFGDLFLASRRRSWFLWGMGAFLLAHLAYLVAFLERGVAPFWILGAYAVLVVPRGYLLRRILPHARGRALRVGLQVYASVLSLMVAGAVGTVAAWWSLPLLVGAVAFWASDLFVARERFLQPGFVNRAVGLPLYYLAQVLLALTVAP